jgi:hypothetical protein
VIILAKKDKPLPPTLPPSEKSKLRENFCLFHKGEIKGDIYECPSCHTKYCWNCAKDAKQEGKKCVKCKTFIFIQKN